MFDELDSIYNSLPVYCIKFCPDSNQKIFAAAILNTVKIYNIKSNDEVVHLYTYKIEGDEKLHALDWSINEENQEAFIITGGSNKRVYNLQTSSVFQVSNDTINDIKFNPKIPFLFAVGCADGAVYLYNILTEICVAIFQTNLVDGQILSVVFDLNGKHMAFGGMSNEIFITNLKDNEQFQDALCKSCSNTKFRPPVFNALYFCTVHSLHNHHIDMIHWYDDYSLISKSADGKIVFWSINGGQTVPFQSNDGIKVIKERELFIRNCSSKFGIDSQMEFLSVGISSREILLWSLKGDELKCEILNITNAKRIARYFSFSNCGRFLIFCTEDGCITVYRKRDKIDNTNQEN